MLATKTAPSIVVEGNVEGSIVVGEHNFVVNTNYGTIVNRQAAPRVKLRDVAPTPPRYRRDFVGRARELSKLDQLIARRDAVVVSGIDGLGKTTLVKQIANGSAAHACPNGVVYLEGVDEQGVALGLGDVIQRLFDALYESEPPLKVNTASARTYLSNTKPLVVLDRLALPASAVSSLADLFPQGALLMTATEATANDDAESIQIAPLARDESTQLFAARAGVALNDSNRATIESLCALGADVPLAIATTANVIREKNLALDQAHQFLVQVKPSSTDPLRAGIERAFALAIAMLAPDERKMLSVAAAAPGVSVDRAWVETLDGGQNVCRRLDALGLLQPNSPRLRVPPGLRAVAASFVNAPAGREQLLTYLRQTLGTRAPDLNFIADELGNLLGLHAWLFAQQRWGDVIALGQAIDPYLTLRGLWDAWHVVLQRVLQAARASGTSQVEAWALHQLGTREIGAGERARAIAQLQQALALRRALGDVIGAAHTQHNLDLLLPPPPPPSEPSKPQTPPGSNWGALADGILSTGLIVIMVAVAITMIWIGSQMLESDDTAISVEGSISTLVPTEIASLLTDTATPTPSTTLTRTPSSTTTPLPSPTNIPSSTPTNTSTRTLTTTPASTQTATSTPTRTRTPTSTATGTPTRTSTPIPGAVRGSIYRAADALSVNNAMVQISGGPSVATGNYSSFSFTNLPPGNHTISVSALGYYPQTKSVTIASGQTTSLNFPLSKAPFQSGTQVALKANQCFDFETGSVMNVGSSYNNYSAAQINPACPVGSDIQWNVSASEVTPLAPHMGLTNPSNNQLSVPVTIATPLARRVRLPNNPSNIQPIIPAIQATPNLQGSCTGEYYNNASLSGSPVVVRTDPGINFNWGTGSPAPGVSSNQFSVRWTCNPQVNAGTYRFTMTVEGGGRVIVDRVTLLDKWFDQSRTTYSTDRMLSAGSHTIRMEYFKSSGSMPTGKFVFRLASQATAQLSVAPVTQTVVKPDIRAVNSAAVDVASPQANAYESCLDITGASVSPAASKYVCVRTANDRIAVMRINGYDTNQLIFDWWRY